MTRGLTTAIVEARDWASGTSSRSSKLIHGGLRYLEMLDFGLVREALRERGLLLDRIAPHLVRPVPFLYPLQHRVWERRLRRGRVRSTTRWPTPRAPPRGCTHHRHLTRKEALREAPCLRPDALTGAIQYWDAQVDDARYTHDRGAHRGVFRRARGEPGQGDRLPARRASGSPAPAVTDLETGPEFEVRAKQVINATGVWTDDTQAMADTRGQFHVRASKGIHLVVPARPAHVQHRDHPADREERAVRHPVGHGTGSSAPPTPTGTWTRRTRRPAPATSTTCSSTSTRCSARR